MYVFKEKSNDELLDMGIAPVARQYWLQGVPLTVKQAEITAEPSKKLSRRQLKKVSRSIYAHLPSSTRRTFASAICCSAVHILGLR